MLGYDLVSMSNGQFCTWIHTKTASIQQGYDYSQQDYLQLGICIQTMVATSTSGQYIKRNKYTSMSH